MADTWIYMPSRTVTGPGAINRLGALASETGTRALLVTEEIFEEYGIIEQVKQSLGSRNIGSITFSEITSASTSRAVENAAQIAKSGKVQMVIGIGGVRTLSIAKCTAKTAGIDQPVDDVLSGEPFSPGGLPYIEVLTTCRNPFLFTDLAVLTDARDRSVQIVHTGLYAQAAVIDPLLAVSLSPKLTSTVMMDTLLLALECFLSKKSSFITDALISRIFKPVLFSVKAAAAEPSNPDLRKTFAEYGLAVSMALSASSIGLGTAAGFVLSGRFSIPHTWISSILLPYMFERATVEAPEKIGQIVTAVQTDTLGTPLETKEELTAFIRHTVASLRLPMRLSALDIDFRKTAACIPNIQTLSDTLYLRNSVTESEIEELIKAAF